MAFAADARRWAGQPVCLTLKDGRSYIGILETARDGSLALSQARRLNPPPRRGKKAKTSGLAGPLFGGNGGGLNPLAGLGLGGAAQGAAGGGGLGGGGIGGLFGKIGGILPMIKVGMNLVQSIWPLLGMFKL